VSQREREREREREGKRDLLVHPDHLRWSGKTCQISTHPRVNGQNCVCVCLCVCVCVCVSLPERERERERGRE